MTFPWSKTRAWFPRQKLDGICRRHGSNTTADHECMVEPRCIQGLSNLRSLVFFFHWYGRFPTIPPFHFWLICGSHTFYFRKPATSANRWIQYQRMGKLVKTEFILKKLILQKLCLRHWKSLCRKNPRKKILQKTFSIENVKKFFWYVKKKIFPNYLKKLQPVKKFL